jgi:hypothetical protein
LENFYLSSNLCLLDWLEDFDDDLLIICGVDSFIYFRILSSSDFLDDLVVLLTAELHFIVFVIRILCGLLLTHVSIIFWQIHVSFRFKIYLELFKFECIKLNAQLINKKLHLLQSVFLALDIFPACIPNSQVVPYSQGNGKQIHYPCLVE